MKKVWIIVAVAGAVVVLGVGGWFGVKHFNKSQVKVFQVSEMSQGFGGNNMSLEGVISSDVSQDIHLTDKQVIEEVFVKEGDPVEVGDPLLSYDMTLVDIELEMEKLNKQGLEIKKKGMENEIQKIKNAQTRAADEKTEPEPPKTEQNEDPPITEPPLGDDIEEEMQEGEDQAYDTLDDTSVPYQGSGTNEDPYLFLCHPNPVLKGSFINKMGGWSVTDTTENTLLAAYCVLEIREDNLPEGILLAALRLDGRTIIDKQNPEEGFQIPLQEESAALKEDVLPDQEPSPGDDQSSGWDIGETVSNDEIVQGYTKEEKEKRIQKKEQEIKTVALDIKQSNLKIELISKKLENQTINSTIKGTVKSVGDPKKGELDGKPFMQVVSSEGLYVKGSISELLLQDVKPGQILAGNSYESGVAFQAEVKEISQYPDASNFYGGMGNQNASYYPFMAFIESGDGLKNQEYVGLQMNIQNAQDADALFLPKMFIREENGKSYVYKAGKDNKLVKQDVETGKSMYGYVTEIKSGVSKEDRLAFPYGKGVRAGAATKDGTMEELYY